MTQKDRLRIYEKFMHKVSMYVTVMDSDKVREGVSLIDSWSYAHRSGNSELTEHEQRKLVDAWVHRMERY
jgi:hypothetical protein